LTESLPKKLKGLLPSPEELEAELSKKDKDRKRRGVSTAEAPMLQTVLIFQGEVNGRTNDHLSEMQDRD